jgi:plasmid stability protein
MVRKPNELRPIMTRVPEALRQRLEREAERNGRSMNAEVIHRLEQSFEKEERSALAQNTADATATLVVNSLRNWIIEEGGRKWLIDPKKLRKKS